MDEKKCEQCPKHIRALCEGITKALQAVYEKCKKGCPGYGVEDGKETCKVCGLCTFETCPGVKAMASKVLSNATVVVLKKGDGIGTPVGNA